MTPTKPSQRTNPPGPSTSPVVAPRLQVQHYRLGDLHTDSRNPRVHSKRQIRLLANSIRALGFNVPILIDAERRVLAGHGRLLAAQSLGYTTVPCVQLEHLTPTQADAFVIAENRLAELATWDDRLLAEQLQFLAAVELNFDIEATGFTVGEIDLRIEGLNADLNANAVDPADELSKLEAVAISQLGDLWRLDTHLLLCGSALEETSYTTLLGDKKAAMAFTDPPYNVPVAGFVGGNGKIQHREFAMGSGEFSDAEFQTFLTSVLRHLARFSHGGTLLYVAIDWRHLPHLLAAGTAADLKLHHLCVWAKDRAGMGSFYRSQHELIVIFKVGSGKSRNNIQLGSNGRHRSNVWNYPSVLNSRHGEEGDLLALHPTVKPIRLVADAILDVTARNDVVLDVFLGSGTTLMACQRVGRICYGMELDPLYVDVAIRRWQRDTGEAAVHALTGETFDDRARRLLAPSTPPSSAPPDPRAQTKASKGRRSRAEVNHG